jgi:hypothetical protein
LKVNLLYNGFAPLSIIIQPVYFSTTIFSRDSLGTRFAPKKHLLDPLKHQKVRRSSSFFPPLTRWWHKPCNYPRIETQNKGGEMKKLTVLLAGFGMILLAGCWENSAAHEKGLILPGSVQSADSSTALSLEERAEKNFTYIKAGPAGPGKVSAEMVVGGLGALLGGTLCATVGFNIGSEGNSGGFCCCDDGGIIGALVGYAVGSNLGAATGVYVVGNSGGEKGSYWAGLGGSLLGTMLGGLVAVSILKSSDDDSGTLPLFILTTAQVGGAAIAFNSTRKRKVEVPSGSILNLKDGKLALSVPEVNITGDAFNSGCYKVNLFRANF